MRNEEIMIDLADPVFTKTIRSRQNDKNGLKLTVYVREKGEKVDLTGYVVKYEATNHTGVFIRDDAQIVDAKNGVFSYSFTSQAVSTSDDWTAYFVMEKDTERMSTPDIRIALRRDVKEGNIKIENYISDFEVLKKTIDELQKKLNAMDVVKKSGDTMIGDLRFVHGKLLRFLTKGGSSSTVTTGVDNLDRWYAWSDAANKGIFNYDPASNLFNLQADTNLVKKAGDIINGILEFKIDNAIVLGSRSFKTVLHKGAQGALIIAPSTEEQGDTWDWSKRVEIRTDGTIKQATDTGWIKLPTTGVENVANRDMKYKRSGENISVIGSVRNPQNEAVFATLPVGFRPVQHIAFPALAYGYTPAACEVTIKPDGGVFVNGVPNGSTVHIAMSFLI
ncbi:BppU family phage baseplate upper protein [Bacillus cereus group sp. MYBK5-2]|uniref:BppU family phage baseplate upper protein n=1 Tax=Bacillus cereus group sp. MYBK5-2 TaxID=3450622 RepID=UPI003F7AFC07